ncbi:RsmB/NOP family class I SAM-dependent RNA methyltransferase, partial [Candidatus Woesearchaeota archaeon]|nr:RsmB/NOP family class I SAM-dependent RNA methyltransferase [Candidatus Woesearchaeota archaeon]
MDNKQFFLNRYQQLGGTIKEIELRKSIRVNTLKISHEQFQQRMKSIGVKLTKISFVPDGYYAEAPFSLGAITEYLLGYYYLQEAAAQLPAQILAPKETDIVLDMCAAPGGKTTQLSQLMNNKGTIVAVEYKEHRIISLCTNLERMGTENVIVLKTNATNLPQSKLRYNKILLDAPCSGNYVTDKNWFSKRTLDGIKKSQQIQQQLLRTAINLLKENGTLVYSTCSLEPEENELNIQWLIDNFNVKLERINTEIGDSGITNVFGQKLHNDIKLCKRFWPHKTNTEGF